MKQILIALTFTLAFAACSDNGSPDDSQNNSKTEAPHRDSSANSLDTAASTPPVNNQGSSGSNDKQTVQPNGVNEGAAASHDTGAMSGKNTK